MPKKRGLSIYKESFYLNILFYKNTKCFIVHNDKFLSKNIWKYFPFCSYVNIHINILNLCICSKFVLLYSIINTKELYIYKI